MPNQSEVITIALLFSHITATANNEEISFLASGIPREYDDLVGWRVFDNFLGEIDKDTETLVHADAYLYGDEEIYKATLEEVAYMKLRLERDPTFLQNRCTQYESVDFTIQWSPEELFGQTFTS